MDFYEQLSSVYDSLFPASENAVRFIAERCPENGRILDVACGTGSHALALAERGFTVMGVDLDESMIEKAKGKVDSTTIDEAGDDTEAGEAGAGGTYAGKMRGTVKFRVGNMLALDELFGAADRFERDRFDVVYCIGNSIVHLESETEIENALRGMRKLLSNNGTCIVQIINFDRIFRNDLHQLPALEAPDGAARLERYYEYDDDDGVVVFRTRLIRNDIDAGPVESRVRLLGVTRERMSSLFADAGFSEVSYFGGFDGAELDAESFAMIAVAR